MKKIIAIGAILLSSVIGLSLMLAMTWYTRQLEPVRPQDTTTVRFVIPRGQASSVIAQRLADAGLIRNYLVFRIFARQEGYQADFQSGSFELRPNMSMREIAVALTKGSEDQWVTIPEGLRREEIAALFTDFALFDPEAFLSLTQGKEGYLFPDTYLFPKSATTEFIVSYLTNTFDTKTRSVRDGLTDQDLAWDELVTLASIVQREAKTPEQMKLVAGILLNRLEIGMALEVDATLQYIKGSDVGGGKWWTVPLAIDKQLESPFNTYKNAGLPPAPISNPGLDALTATVYPTPSEYYFYIHAPDGKMYYGKNYQEHLENIQKYLR